MDLSLLFLAEFVLLGIEVEDSLGKGGDFIGAFGS